MGLIEQYGRYALYATGVFSTLAIVIVLYAFIDRNNDYGWQGVQVVSTIGIIFAVLGAGSLVFYGITLLDAANAERHAATMDQGKDENAPPS